MEFTVTFSMSIDELAMPEEHRSWGIERVKVAMEDTVRASVGFAVPFIQEGLGISVGSFQFVENTVREEIS